MDESTSRVDAPAGALAGRRTRPNTMVLAGGLLVALIALAVAAVLIRPAGPTAYPEGSAEAAFQAYYTAFEDGDLDAAYDWFSSSVQAEMALSEYRRQVSENSWINDQDRRLVLDGVERSNGRAVLHLRVDQFSQGGLGGNRTSYEREVRLVEENGAWRIDEPLVGIEPGYFGY